MSNSKQTAQSGGIGFFGLLAIVFILLKLTVVIDWSWWWVTAPLWLPLPVVLICVFGFLACVFAIDTWKSRK